jgi:hypothetical protein
MKPTKTTAHSRGQQTSSTKPSTPLAIEMPKTIAEQHDRGRDHEPLTPRRSAGRARSTCADRRGAQLVEVAALDLLDEEQRGGAERRREQQRAGSWNAP